MEYASRLQRFIAFIIDVIVLAVIVGILTAIGIVEFSVSEEASTTDGLIQAIIVGPTTSFSPLPSAPRSGRWRWA
jgi:hypothetical protein